MNHLKLYVLSINHSTVLSFLSWLAVHSKLPWLLICSFMIERPNGKNENTLGYPRDQKINKKNPHIVVYNTNT